MLLRRLPTPLLDGEQDSKFTWPKMGEDKGETMPLSPLKKGGHHEDEEEIHKEEIHKEESYSP
jgi:hypothetical protein